MNLVSTAKSPLLVRSNFVLVLLGLLIASQPARADSLADCTRAGSSELRLRACSDVITSARFGAEDKALAYRTRGNMRTDAGAARQAVADFNEAVRLRPNDVAGYAGRARARLALQDFDGVIADYNEALRLAPATFLSRG